MEKSQNIKEEIEPNSVIILLNDIYFKGVWQAKFDEKESTQKTFNNLNDKNKTRNKSRYNRS